MSLARLGALMRKEFRQILRDPQILFMTLVAPVFVLFLLAYTFAADLGIVSIGLWDQDRSAVSRELLGSLVADGEVQLAAVCSNYGEIESLLRSGEAVAVLVVPAGFGASVQVGRPEPLQLVVDASDYHYAAQIYGGLAQRCAAFGAELLAARGVEITVPVALKTRALYNPTLEWIISMVPGLMAASFCFPAIAVALACTREVEQGSYEGLLSTPVRVPEYMLGKLLPYLMMGTVGSLFAWLLARLWFKVPFRGLGVDYVLMAALFLLSLMSVSLLIGTVSGNQRHAVVIIVLVFFIPTFFMSGLLQPLEREAVLTRVLETVLPAANYVPINRALFLKGLPLSALHKEIANLLRITTVALVASWLLARRKVA